jgi:multidrug efflux pump subunit AcrB
MEQILTIAGYGILGMLFIFFTWTLRGAILFSVLFALTLRAAETLNPVAAFAVYFFCVPTSLLLAMFFHEWTENLFKRPNGYK